MSVPGYELRYTRPEDIDPIIEVCGAVYPDTYSWGPNQLNSHLETFPEGQFVVIEKSTGLPVGMAASLIVDYDEYDLSSKWKDITEWGYFGTHDPAKGRTLYGAEVMVHPRLQGKGIGKMLYLARERLTRDRKLLNIRAGARISAYHRFADRLNPREYVLQVLRGALWDPTLSFQLKRGFRVVGLTPRYFHDPDSLHHAAVIEWLNPEVATPEDLAYGDAEFREALESRK